MVSRIVKDRMVDRAVRLDSLKHHRRTEDPIGFDAEGRRNIRARMHDRSMAEQIDGLDITPMRIRG